MARIFPESEEIGLDPEDWNSMRELGHRMVDDMVRHLQTVRERPAWQPIPAEVKDQFTVPAPETAEGAEKAYQDFQQLVLPYPLGNTHPRFWGWVIGTGTVLGMFAEMLAAGMNPNVFSAEQSAALVEEQTLNWLKEMLGYPAAATGLLVSGGTMANLLGLTVGRNTQAPEVLKEGVYAKPGKLLLYASAETHNSVMKAAMMQGLGFDAVRKIRVDSDYRIILKELRQQIAEDRAAGNRPFCVVGNAGTVNTGAFDDLNAIADICKHENLWFHVDGAFGALAALSPQLKHFTAGMDRADSLAFDLHKWFYMAYEAGCVLFRDPQKHAAAFSVSASYLSRIPRGTASGGQWFSELGLQLSRGFRALKVWMSFKEHGVGRYRTMVEQNVGQARYLASLIEQQVELELLAPVPLNVVCFRYRGGEESSLNDRNREILMRLQETGIAVPSSTVLNGKFAIRVAITNHRTRKPDLDLLVAKVLEFGR